METIPLSINAFKLSNWLNSSSSKPLIIDVRENQELELARFPDTTIHIPMSKVSIPYVKSELSNLLDKKFVILCHRGIRSFAFGKWLLDNNFLDQVWNLEEGIDGWSKDIDPTIPRY